MLTKQLLIEADGLQIHDVRCGRPRGSWSAPEPSVSHAVVFVRRGCFLRKVDGDRAVLDPAVAYFERPGHQQQVAHPFDTGDVCTTVTLPGWLTDELHPLPDRPVFTDPRIDLAHRVLVARARVEPDPFEAGERALLLVTDLLEPSVAVETGRPATRAARRRIVDDARQSLAQNLTASLRGLARTVAVSPHHLSRIFRACTGQTLTRYRNRVRVRLALERLAGGEDDLATLAADLDFADHAHLDRVVRRETGHTPSALRSALANRARSS